MASGRVAGVTSLVSDVRTPAERSLVCFSAHLLSLHRLYIYQSIEYGLRSSTGYVCPCTACAVVSLLDNHVIDPLLLHRWCSHQATEYGCNHLCSRRPTGYGLQSSKRCVSPAPLVQSSVYQVQSTIIQGMRFSCNARAVISLLGTVSIIPAMSS